MVLVASFGVAFGVGIGIGAGIWKESSPSSSFGPFESSEWYYLEQAETANVTTIPGGDDDQWQLTLGGVSPVVLGIAGPSDGTTSGMQSMMITPSIMVSMLNIDPGKNALLGCAVGEKNVVLPVTLQQGNITSSGEVVYVADPLPFDAESWKHMDYATEDVLTRSNFTGSNTTLEFGSCDLYIDSFWGSVGEGLAGSLGLSGALSGIESAGKDVGKAAKGIVSGDHKACTAAGAVSVIPGFQATGAMCMADPGDQKALQTGQAAGDVVAGGFLGGAGAEVGEVAGEVEGG